MTWDRIEGAIESIFGSRGREVPGRRASEAAREAGAFDELVPGARSGGERSTKLGQATSLQGGRGASQGLPSALVLAPAAAGEFANEQGTVSLRMQREGSAVLAMAGKGRAELVLNGIRSGAHLYLAGEKGPVLRGEIVALDDSSRFTLVGFESLSESEISGHAPRRGLITDTRRHRFHTPDSDVIGAWDPATHRLRVRLQDQDGDPVMEIDGLYGDRTAVVRLADDRVLGLTYEFPTSEDGESTIGPFMWVGGPVPLVPPLRDLWDSLPVPSMEEPPADVLPRAPAEDPASAEQISAAMLAAGLQPGGDKVLSWRRLAPAMDGLARYLLGRDAGRTPASPGGTRSSHLFDSTA